MTKEALVLNIFLRTVHFMKICYCNKIISKSYKNGKHCGRMRLHDQVQSVRIKLVHFGLTPLQFNA